MHKMLIIDKRLKSRTNLAPERRFVYASVGTWTPIAPLLRMVSGNTTQSTRGQMMRARRLKSGHMPLQLTETLLAFGGPPCLRQWSPHLADTVHLRIDNRPTAIGKPAAIAELGLLFDRTRALGEGFRTLWPSEDGETVLAELDLSPLDGGAALPLAMILRALQPAPEIRDLRFYLDPTPLGIPRRQALV